MRRAHALVLALLQAPHAVMAAPAVAVALAPQESARAFQPRITELIGSNGWPTSAEDFRFWQSMGLSWGRDAVGPGRDKSPASPMQIDRTGPGDAPGLPGLILANNRHGIKSLLLLAYTPAWNAAVAGDPVSAPLQERYWQEYVEAVVSKYSAPPYNVKYFQIWNEAAGVLSGGSPQATFWHGPPGGSGAQLTRPYANAMADYVNLIHLPAARIIRAHHAYVVYGGWPDQGGLDTYFQWLEYESPSEHARMLDYVDYLDVHYMGVGDIDTLYQRYVASGKVRGVWQTEIGDEYMRDPQYLPRYYFSLAVWALSHHWDDPDKYLAIIYHWDGYEPFRLTYRGPPRTYTVPGRALMALRINVAGPLAPFPHPFHLDPGSEAIALKAGNKIVFQVSAPAGPHRLRVDDLAAPASGHYEVTYVDAVTGATLASAAIPGSAAAASPGASLSSQWQGSQLSVSFTAPAPGRDAGGKPLAAHLGYLSVSVLP